MSVGTMVRCVSCSSSISNNSSCKGAGEQGIAPQVSRMLPGNCEEAAWTLCDPSITGITLHLLASQIMACLLSLEILSSIEGLK